MLSHETIAPATSNANIRSSASLLSHSILARRGKCLVYMEISGGNYFSGRQRAYDEGNVNLGITKLDTVSRSWSSCL